MEPAVGDARLAPAAGAAGLERAPVNLLRIPPGKEGQGGARRGKESFTYHAHLHEEEWVYFPREGKRMVRLGERATVYELASGAPSPFPGTEPI